MTTCQVDPWLLLLGDVAMLALLVIVWRYRRRFRP